ncbi:hypothetical protein [Azohydromonas lata]|uniref:hypothetical protein n=1 Tax=Azohydromonas lata TaxID=45677 RepID=UPI0012F50A75|nr:hypothetical protein [Azohydromonas lata]
MKTCTKCKETLPLDVFARDSQRAGGLRLRCKSCDNERRRSWTKANPERTRIASKRKNAARDAARVEARTNKLAALPPDKKKCPQCASIYPLAEFPVDKTKSSGHTSWCRNCYRHAWRSNYQEHAPKRRAQQRQETAELSDGYVRRKLIRDSGIQPGDVPQALIDLKREHLRLLRQLRKDKDENC